MMLQEHDLVHMRVARRHDADENEGFRCKPVLTFWMMAARHARGRPRRGRRLLRRDGARRAHDVRDPPAVRPVRGARPRADVVDARAAGQSRGSRGSRCSSSGRARSSAWSRARRIPDMPLAACVMGAIAMFTMAVEDGDASDRARVSIRLPAASLAIDHAPRRARDRRRRSSSCRRSTTRSTSCARRSSRSRGSRSRSCSSRCSWASCSRRCGATAGWSCGSLAVIIGSLIATRRRGDRARDAARLLATLDRWERYAPDRYVIRAIAFPIVWARRRRLGSDRRRRRSPARHGAAHDDAPGLPAVVLRAARRSASSRRARPGSPSSALVGVSSRRAVRPLARALRGQVRAQARPAADDRDRSCRGTSRCGSRTACASSTSTCSRTSSTAPRSASTTRPARSSTTRRSSATACGCGRRCCRPRSRAAFLRSRTDTREGRVRFMIALWAICGVAFFSHRPDQVPPLHPAGGPRARHPRRVLPRRPARAAASGCTRSTRALGIGIVLLVCRDLMWEPERWIEMFVFRYDRPWPSGEPWSIDPSRWLPRARRRSRASRSSIAALAVAPRSASPRSCVAGPRDLRVVAAGLHADRRQALGHARGDAQLLRAAHDLRREARLLRPRRARRRLGATPATSGLRDVRARHAPGRPADDDHGRAQQGRRRADRWTSSSRSSAPRPRSAITTSRSRSRRASARKLAPLRQDAGSQPSRVEAIRRRRRRPRGRRRCASSTPIG